MTAQRASHENAEQSKPCRRDARTRAARARAGPRKTTDSSSCTGPTTNRASAKITSQPTALTRRLIPVHRRQRRGHAERGEQLEVRQMRGAERAESVRQARDRTGVVPFRQHEREPVRGERRQRIRSEQDDVVRGDRIRAEPLQRRREDAFAEAMIRERDRSSGRPESDAVPPARRERRHVGVPPEEHGAQHRIAHVVRHHRSQVADEWIRHHAGQRRVKDADGRINRSLVGGA